MYGRIVPIFYLYTKQKKYECNIGNTISGTEMLRSVHLLTNYC